MHFLLTLENTVGGSICTIAVPLFYLISGFLFFVKIPQCCADMLPKIKKRCRTLLIPYLLANIFTFIFYAVINLIAHQIPAVDSIVNFKVLDTVVAEGLWPTIKLVFINPPIAFQLWFVRDLMVVILFSPIIYLILSYMASARWTSILLLLLLLLGLVVPVHLPFDIAALWFTLGGLISICRIDISPISKPLYPAICLLSAYACLCVFNGNGLLPGYLTCVIPLVGIPALWYTYDTVMHIRPSLQNSKPIVLASKYTFFVYLCHEPLLNIFKKLPMLFNRSEIMLVFCYLLIPIFFYALACIAGNVLKRYFPVLYSLYTGGR